jgi:hypothetical protein
MKRTLRPALPRPVPPTPREVARLAEKRRHLRFDKLLAVSLEAPQHGAQIYVARNVSEGGMFLESREPLPLGCPVLVHFSMPEGGGEIVARGEVKNHYYINYADATGPRAMAGMGIRFLEFEEESQVVLAGELQRIRVLH